MSTNLLIFYRQIFILLFIQLFVVDYLNQLSNYLIYFQALVLIWLPIQFYFIRALPFILIFALIIDLFNHTLGLNLMVCTFVLYFRTYLISFFLDKEDDIRVIHIYSVGFKTFLYYTLLINILFYFLIFSIEFFRWPYSWDIFEKWGISVLSMTGIVVFLDLILMKNKK